MYTYIYIYISIYIYPYIHIYRCLNCGWISGTICVIFISFLGEVLKVTQELPDTPGFFLKNHTVRDRIQGIVNNSVDNRVNNRFDDGLNDRVNNRVEGRVNNRTNNRVFCGGGAQSHATTPPVL